MFAKCNKSFQQKVSLTKQTRNRVLNSAKFYLNFYEHADSHLSFIFIEDNFDIIKIGKQELQEIINNLTHNSFYASDKELKKILTLVPNYHQYIIAPDAYFSPQYTSELQYTVRDLKHELEKLFEKKTIMEDSHVRWSYVDNIEKEIQKLKKKLNAFEAMLART